MAPPSNSPTGLSSTGAVVVAVLVAFAGMDVLSTFKEAEKEANPLMVQADGPPMDQKSLGGRVHISYCNSWSYRGGFMQVNQLIRQHFPGTEVVGSNYPPTAMNVALSKVASFGSMAAIAVSIFGDKIFEVLGTPMPEFVTSMQANKMGSCMGAWFLGNMVQTNLLNTGAFEIYYEGKVIFSKMQEKRLPNIPELLASLEQAMKSSVHPPEDQPRRAIPTAPEPEVIEQTDFF